MLPGLIADVIYLRPAHRAPLLRLMADLGIFVRESNSLPRNLGHRVHSDMVVAVTDCSSHGVDAVRQLSDASALVVALVERPTCVAALLQAGASSVAAEATGATFRNAINDAAKAARSRRANGPSTGVVRVFGNLEFREAPRELGLGRKASTLSPVEFSLMQVFVRYVGELVPRPVLHSCLRRNGAEVSDGYLKTVILRIRRKAETLGGDPTLLGAVRGSGYILRG